ncbi:MAG TPA: PilT/PilU family type 4a pilus ATPase [Kofleriaceae bacterium]|nr:PilT/PilU family type 4a pilus ATPase [Kofleriaceae bacterium]
MSAKLDQLLGYLDRADVTEIIVGIGRPIALKTGQGYMQLTSLPVSELQFATLVGGTALDKIHKTAGAQPIDCDVGRRRVRVELVRRPEGSALRIQAAPAAAPAPAVEPVAVPMVKFATPQAAVAEPADDDEGVELGAPVHDSEPVQATAPAQPEAQPDPVETAEDLGEDAIFDEQIDSRGIERYVRAARQKGASDLHIVAGRPAMVRLMGELRPLDPTPVPADIVDRMLLPLLGPRRRVRLRTVGYVDLAFDVQGAGRLRGNVSRLQGGLRGAFRLARVTPPTLEELDLPRELAKVTAHHQGLVVIAGPNGQGKTTTMTALVDLINSTKAHHIITIEDPVELEHPRKQSVISQREVGRHTKSFAAALKASLREDPDVIVIGELRDRETVEIALTAAETGHLVLATMSTPSAAKTIDRLIDMFPPDEQTQARASIAGALKAIVAQRLLPSTAGGVVPAIELVTGVLPLAVLIRDDKLFQLPNLMQRGRAFGMIRFDDSLLELLRAGKITEDTLRQYSPTAANQAKQPAQPAAQPMGRGGRRE